MGFVGRSSSFTAIYLILIGGAAAQDAMKENPTALPKTIAAVQFGAPLLDDEFRQSLTNDMKYCGASFKFLGAGDREATEALFTIEEISKQCKSYCQIGDYACMDNARKNCQVLISTTYRFTFKSTNYQKILWQAEIDWEPGVGHYNRKRTGYIKGGEAYAEKLMLRLKSDGFLNECDVEHLPELKK